MRINVYIVYRGAIYVTRTVSTPALGLMAIVRSGIIHSEISQGRIHSMDADEIAMNINMRPLSLEPTWCLNVAKLANGR